MNIIRLQWLKMLGLLSSQRGAMLIAGAIVSALVAWGESLGVELSPEQQQGAIGVIALFVAGIIGESIRPMAPRYDNGEVKPPANW
jgi:hypothetical protein